MNMILVQFFVFVFSVVACAIGLATEGWMCFWSMFLVTASLNISIYMFGWFGILMYLPVLFVFSIVFFMVGAFVGIPGAVEPSLAKPYDEYGPLLTEEEEAQAEAVGKEFGETPARVIKKTWGFLLDYWWALLILFGIIIIANSRANKNTPTDDY